MTDNERERAAYYEAHKDDPELWGDPEPAPKQRRRPASIRKHATTPDEAPVYMRIGEHGTEHRIGWVRLPPDPAALGTAIAQLLHSAALQFETTNTNPDPTPKAGQP